MTNSQISAPDIIFGTGVTTSSINAWSILPSTMTQSPINMQFPIPRKLNKNKPLSLDLYFLVSNHAAAAGKARIMVNVEYLDQNASFDVSNNATFSYSAQSKNFTVAEPVAGNLTMICINVPLETTGLRKSMFALLSVTRMAPTSGTEYAEDIYLSAANFRYVTK